MARGWPFVGGLLIVTTVTYLNMNTITAIAKDIQSSLIKERKKLEEARAGASPSPESSDTDKGRDHIRFRTTRVSERIKKMWNQDIERSVRRLQNTDWERMVKSVEARVKRARERMLTSFERMGGDESKKNSTS